MQCRRNRSKYLGTPLLGLLLSAAVAFGGPHLADSPPAHAQGTGDTSLVRELAERLLAAQYPGQSSPPAQLLPGQLPNGLPLDIPVAPRGRLLGSMVRPAAGQAPATTIVVLDAPGDLAQAFNYYQRAFQDQGWTAPPSGGAPVAPLGGFVTTQTSNTTFCHGDAWAMLGVTPLTAGVNDVRITLNSTPGPCTPPVPPPSVPPGPPGANLIPRLQPPDGVTLQPGGSPSPIGGPGGWSSQAVALTDKSPGELEAFFAQQLQAAGWARTAGQVDGPVAWSLWQVPGDDGWQGFLVVLNGPGQNRRLLSVRVDSAPASPGSVDRGTSSGRPCIMIYPPPPGC